MPDNLSPESIKGDRSMTQGFVAQYASEAALQIDGVVSLVPSFAVALKEKAGDFLYRFRLRRVYHHPAVRAFVVAEESCSFRQMKNDSKPLYRYKTFLCSSLRG